MNYIKIGPVDIKFLKYGLTNIKTSSLVVAKRIFYIIVNTQNLDNGSELRLAVFVSCCESKRIELKFIQPGKPK
jgi:hypothetical protein